VRKTTIKRSVVFIVEGEQFAFVVVSLKRLDYLTAGWFTVARAGVAKSDLREKRTRRECAALLNNRSFIACGKEWCGAWAH